MHTNINTQLQSKLIIICSNYHLSIGIIASTLSGSVHDVGLSPLVLPVCTDYNHENEDNNQRNSIDASQNDSCQFCRCQ